MKKIFKDMLLVSSLGFFISSSLIQAQNPPYFINGRTYFLQDSIWYVENSMTSANFRVDVNSITVKLNNPANFSSMENLINNIGIEIKRENILGYIDIFIPSGLDIFQVWGTLKNTGLFESVEINSFGEPLYSPPSVLTPNDPDYGQQYHLNHSTYPDINAPEAWDLCNNFGEGVIIAILDNGFNYEHPDLIDNVWPGLGWDFYEGQPVTQSNRREHSTVVAGLAGASTNNNLGVSGIAGGWDPTSSGIQLMSVIVITIETVKLETVDDAVLYAVVNGAKILNMSWRSDNSSALDAAFEFAYNVRGSMLIAAGGNVDSYSFVEYPAKNRNVIAVAGIEKNWTHLGNYGNELEISAPAEDIYSTRYDQINDISYYGIFRSGTSFASPMVCGAAALLWSNYPTLTNFDIRRILRETAYSDFSTYDELYFGDGLLKIDSSLLYVQNIPNKPTGVSIYAPIGGNPTISWNPVPGADYYKFYRSEPNSKMLLYSIITTIDTFHTDNEITVVHPKFAPLTYYYRVTSVDNGYESPVSSEVSCGSNSAEKIVGNGNTKNLKTVELFHNFPNPFNPATVIKYRINEDSFVQLKVYDILGRLVKTLVSITQAVGEYSIEFNAEDLSSGVYFYTLSANDFYQTKKMILLP